MGRWIQAEGSDQQRLRGTHSQAALSGLCLICSVDYKQTSQGSKYRPVNFTLLPRDFKHVRTF